jgi:putative addiction module component (TIGR02574 family)
VLLFKNTVVLKQGVVHIHHPFDIKGSSLRFRYIIGGMSQETSDLLKKALNLPVAERAELAGSLIESLDETEDESVQATWDAEIVRRMEDLELGKVKPVSLQEARRRLSSAIE